MTTTEPGRIDINIPAFVPLQANQAPVKTTILTCTFAAATVSLHNPAGRVCNCCCPTVSAE